MQKEGTWYNRVTLFLQKCPKYVTRYINYIFGTVAILAILIMIASTVADVSGRYLLNSPILGTIELNRTLLVFVVFLSLGYAQLKKQHMRVDMILTKFGRTGVIIDVVGLLIALSYIGLMTYGTGRVAYEATSLGEYETGIINFPMWPGRIAIAVGCLILFIQYAADIIQKVKSLS